jgi:hypothetical protein
MLPNGMDMKVVREINSETVTAIKEIYLHERPFHPRVQEPAFCAGR